jgi:uncharacterized protein (TIGR01244 family)
MTKSYFAAFLCAITLGFSNPSFAASDLSRALTPEVSVSGQMTLEKFQALMKDGFQSVIVNRPDQEDGNLVKVDALRNIAEKAHVSVIYQPVISGQMKQTDVEEFARYYNELPKPILMVCRSGSRSSQLFQQAKIQGLIHE